MNLNPFKCTVITHLQPLLLKLHVSKNLPTRARMCVFVCKNCYTHTHTLKIARLKTQIKYYVFVQLYSLYFRKPQENNLRCVFSLDLILLYRREITSRHFGYTNDLPLTWKIKEKSIGCIQNLKKKKYIKEKEMSLKC